MNAARSCAERKLDLIALLDGELAPAAQAELDAHVLGCDECRADLAELQSTSTLLRRWESVDPPRDLAPALPEPRRAVGTQSGPQLTVLPGRRLRDLFLPAGLGAALAAAAVVLLFRLGAVSTGGAEVAEIRALSAEVAALRTELAQAQSALAQASAPVPAGAVTGVLPSGTSPSAPAASHQLPLSAAEHEALMKQVASAIAESESRQDTKFLFTTDQLARSLSMQRREDLATIERQLRDARAETFQALVTTHERLDRLAQPALLEQGIAPRSEGEGSRSGEHNADEGRGSVPAEDRLEPRSRK